MARKQPLRKRKRSHRGLKCVFILLAAIGLAYVGIHFSSLKDFSSLGSNHATPYAVQSPSFQEDLEAFAQEHDLDLSEWPHDLLEAADRNAEMESFALHYPLNKDKTPEIDLDEYQNADTVPLLLQWDERWGYTQYAGGPMGLTGCGPTCLSMVSIYLLHDTSYDPRYIAQFSIENGYSVPGNGSAWALISEGGPQLGLDVTEIPLDENRIIQNLEVGNPIICVMGPGDFTTTGHFIVMTGYTDGKIEVNDPNSRARSNLLWEYDKIEDQILNLWVCR